MVHAFPLRFSSTDLGATEEVQNLRSSLRQARQDHQALETQVRELRSTETSTKVDPFVLDNNTN